MCIESHEILAENDTYENNAYEKKIRSFSLPFLVLCAGILFHRELEKSGNTVRCLI